MEQPIKKKKFSYFARSRLRQPSASSTRDLGTRLLLLLPEWYAGPPCSSRKCSFKKDWNFPDLGVGSPRLKHLKDCVKLNWKFQWGGLDSVLTACVAWRFKQSECAEKAAKPQNQAAKPQGAWQRDN